MKQFICLALSFSFCAVSLSHADQASSSARYRVNFEGLWSAATHPQDFPSNPHFSTFIGATHDDSIILWKPGVFASKGIQDVSELGSVSSLTSEISQAILDGAADFIIQGNGLTLPGSESMTIEVKKSHPFMTVLSMIAPSPDWFTGVQGLSLLDNGNWVDQLVIDLFPYDAGTDSGVTYLSPDLQTIPPQPIEQITSFPFEFQGDVAPVGKLTIQRIDLPFCDLEMTQSTYADEDIFAINSWLLANHDIEERAVDIKIWLRISVPGTPFDISIFNLSGPDGSIVLPANSEQNIDPFPLFVIDSSFPRGIYELNCLLEDPVTGMVLDFDRNVVEVR